MTNHSCANCEAPLQWKSDYARCSVCKLRQSRLQPKILDETAWRQLDEIARGTALQALRKSNFTLLLQRLQTLKPGATLLDVGAAHGWFVEQANAAGYKAIGLEPDPRLAAFARKLGVVIQEGFFPHALATDQRFDVLVFNDVFEHLPNPRKVMADCFSHLNKDGLLILNLPLATGFFFRLATAMRLFGFASAWRRLWQVGFPSPHLFFYGRKHLSQIATPQGFRLVHQSSLPSLSTSGLWSRLRMDNTQPLWLHCLQWPLLMLLAPLLRLLPKDIGLLIFQKYTEKIPS